MKKQTCTNNDFLKHVKFLFNSKIYKHVLDYLNDEKCGKTLELRQKVAEEFIGPFSTGNDTTCAKELEESFELQQPLTPPTLENLTTDEIKAAFWGDPVLRRRCPHSPIKEDYVQVDKTIVEDEEVRQCIRLANAFSTVIKKWTTPDVLRQIVKLNMSDPEAQSGKICHTHDFIDGNEAMLQAMENINEEYIFAPENDDPNFDEETRKKDKQGVLMDKAWNLAKALLFSNSFLPLQWESVRPSTSLA